MSNNLKQLSAYVDESDPLYQAVQAEAKDKAVSVSTVIKWALMDRYEHQVKHLRQFADGVPATP